MGREKEYFDHEKLRQILAERGISLYRLAKDCGYTRPVLSRTASGERTPQYNTVAAIAEALGVSLDFFLKKEDSV
jgi:transcriptional regulator with XRE-family HTH domain